ncbi:MAG: MMPL family transporter [Actinomycetota bacterium]|nr:MMPL family transporter [Actinomycetota bacterium]
MSAVAIGAIGTAVGSKYTTGDVLKGTESTRAINLLSASAPKASGDSDQIVIATKSGTVNSPAVKASVNAMLAQVAQIPHVGTVSSPYSANGARQISPSGTVEYASVIFDRQGDAVPIADVNRVASLARTVASPTVHVALGGQAFARTNSGGTGGLPIGFAAAAVVLVIAFGSLLAAALPLITAAFALIIGIMLVGMLSRAISMPDFASQLSLLIGLGVGVDYALFIVTRYRQGLMRGMRSEDALVQSIDTSGRAVLFAGATVCIALLGLLALGIPLLSGGGIAASVVVAFTVLASLTLLPALLGFFGPRTLTRRARRALKAGSLTVSDESPAWARWTGTLQRRPAAYATLGTIVMLVIAIPFLSMRVGSADAGSDPAGSTTRQAYDLLAKGFGPGFNGPLLLVAKTNTPAQTQQFAHMVTAVRRTPDVVVVSRPQMLRGGLETVQVFERGSPQAVSTSNLLSTLRTKVIPQASQHQIDVLVGGQTAVAADFSGVISSKLPLFIGVVVLLSFLLLTAVFRSLVIPAMAAVMNLVSVGAAFGVVTAVFQNGWGASLIGVDSTGPISAFVPVFVFAILFGLSMDYQVFLVSRMYEEWHRRRDNTAGVTHGLAATGRTITTAAAIMVVVFSAFILAGDRPIKLFGVGLASAVLLDALVIRSVVVPGLMLAVGKTNWQLPRALERRLPRLNVEGAVDAEAQTSDGTGRGPEPQPTPAT